MIHGFWAALVAAASIGTPSWQFVDEGQHNGTKWYLDKRSLVVAGIYRSARIKAVHGPRLGGGHDVYFKSFDCLNRTSTPIRVTSTNGEGRVIVDLRYQATDVTAATPTPGSVSESVLNAVCS